MSTLKKTLYVLAATLLLSACGKGDKRSRINDNNPITVNGTTFNGRIYAASGVSQDEFQLTVDSFYSVTNDPTTLFSNVSADTNSDSGLWFQGRVSLSGARFNPNGNNNATVISSGSTDMSIVLRDDRGYELVSNFIVSGGQVNGTLATVNLYESGVGTITLTGEIVGGFYAGRIDFQNERSFDGSAGRYGTLGSFYIPTCEFFVCN